jgi:predicted DNA-binding transcriptional regulator YafY
MSEIDRLYTYKSLFSSKRAVSKSDILNKLEISEATFKRDLTKLRDRLNTPVLFDRELGGYRLQHSDADSELPGLWLNQEEVLALLTIQNMLESLEPTFIGPKIKPLQNRLNDILIKEGLNSTDLAKRIKIVHAGKRTFKLKSFELICKATFERNQINIIHFNRQSGESVSRKISPQQLIHYRDNWYVDAWCHLRDGIRSFSIDAISDCQILDSKAKEVSKEILKEQLEGGYGIFGGKATNWATLKFNEGRARWVKNEIWHPDQLSTFNSDGTLTLQIPYSDSRELIGDILKFGNEVEIISPEVLVSEYKKIILFLLKKYEKHL